MNQLIERPRLKDVAHAQSDSLHDVELLLNLMSDRLPVTTSPADVADLSRLISMARDKVRAVNAAIDPYI